MSLSVAVCGRSLQHPSFVSYTSSTDICTYPAESIRLNSHTRGVVPGMRCGSGKISELSTCAGASPEDELRRGKWQTDVFEGYIRNGEVVVGEVAMEIISSARGSITVLIPHFWLVKHLIHIPIPTLSTAWILSALPYVSLTSHFDNMSSPTGGVYTHPHFGPSSADD